jgi:hypothetical protein
LFSHPSFAGNSDAGLRLFLDTYQCPLTHQLELVHGNKTRATSRFILLSLDKASQRYVQCIFKEADTKILCEASSGFHGPRIASQQTFRVSQAGLKALSELGFSIAETEGNYQLLITPPASQDFKSVAALMLTALFRGYGAQFGARLWYSIPLGNMKEFKPTQCVPTG